MRLQSEQRTFLPVGERISVSRLLADYVELADVATRRNIATMLRSIGRDSSLFTATGWDDVTGLGSPRAVQLVDALR